MGISTSPAGGADSARLGTTAANYNELPDQMPSAEEQFLVAVANMQSWDSNLAQSNGQQAGPSPRVMLRDRDMLISNLQLLGGLEILVVSVSIGVWQYLRAR
jgi:hypothetical protein